MMQNPSLTGGKNMFPVCRRCSLYSQNECPHFGHYLHEKIQKVSDGVGRCGGKTGRTQMMSEGSAVTVMSQNEATEKCSSTTNSCQPNLDSCPNRRETLLGNTRTAVDERLSIQFFSPKHRLSLHPSAACCFFTLCF